ncbi:MAG TPA: Slp family lipoprotein [Thermodesulfovibrionales bacterium]|jgi:outer membrane lipoprotein|nr:Slp family lipoprotein [Thermodesulfovibrionales bacterium]
MRKPLIIIVFVLSASLLSCAPVLRKDLMESAIRDFSMNELRKNPGPYQGKLFVFGGIIAQTKITSEGSLIEALSVRVDPRGYLKGFGPSDGRFLALYPKEQGFLDPLIYSQGREVTLAAEFIGTREGTIDEAAYLFPFFAIKDLYLWAQWYSYPWPPYYYYAPYYPYYGDPFYRYPYYPYWW